MPALVEARSRFPQASISSAAGSEVEELRSRLAAGEHPDPDPDALAARIVARLEATLRLYRDPEKALREVPILRMLAAPPAELRQRCESFASRLRSVPGLASIETRDDVAYVGGGSLPDVGLPTVVIAIAAKGMSEEELATRLRTGSPGVVGRIQEGKLLLDLRTVFGRQEDDLLRAIGEAVQAT